MTDIQQDHGPAQTRRFGRTKTEIEIEDAATVTWLIGVAAAIVAGGYLFLSTFSGVDQATLDAAVGARSANAAHSGTATVDGSHLSEGMQATPVAATSTLATPPIATTPIATTPID
ncbi:hypothetical protein E2A64_08150 [Pseudohoeflea suaedae]|uniref:Uncharacterized protein n=1 Tax=Pseudohoeflea suaedae TaxID=877384 RepID=A0A4R5PPL0_9HYPH|nr:hypothetical protein [Pseudohoeflea suaedae]TDH39044.1 hypothetical protein E2A64_08150 [Pseudohoeflea suaedae]